MTTTDNIQYSVSNLSEQVGVPRTTINDWLSRYSQYIDFKIQGKRKVYSHHALCVLKDISELRNSGLSSFDIEEELLKQHPVHGEIAPNETPKPKDVKQQKKGNIVTRSSKSGNVEEFALIAKQQADEIGQLISNQLSGITDKIEAIELNNRKSNSKAARWHAVAIFLTISLIALGTLSFIKIQNRIVENMELKQSVAVVKSRLQAQTASLNEKTTLLDRNDSNYKKNIAQLEHELNSSRELFRERIEAAKKDASAEKNARIAAMRDSFAGERLKLLKELEQASQDGKAKELLIQQLQAQSLKQSKSIENLTESALQNMWRKLDYKPTLK